MQYACILISVFCLSLIAQIATAQDIYFDDLTPLSGQALTDAFKGVTMDGVYKYPRQRSGTQRFTETFLEDGTTRYREGQVSDIGEWTVKGDTICFSYRGQLSGSLSCFNVFQQGKCYYSYQTNSRSADRPARAYYWSAKTVVQGDSFTCDDLVS